MGRSAATATFVATSDSTTASTNPAAPVVPGWRWITKPGCGPISVLPGVTVMWDAQGYVFCCSTLGTDDQPSPRCSGQKETSADCGAPPGGIDARLIQPGGCYELDSFP